MLQDAAPELLARARCEEYRRAAEAARFAAVIARGPGLRPRLGRALIRLGAALAEAERVPAPPGDRLVEEGAR